MTDYPLTRALAFEESENVGRNPTENPTIGDVIAARYDRRDILRGALGVAAIAATVSPLAIAASQQAHAQGGRFPFREVAAGVDEKHHVAEGYDADILIRWGDKVLPGAPAFDPLKQTAAAQKQQFGYNNDYLGYIPMPGAANPSQHGLLVVNLEYTNEELMFPGIGIDQQVKTESFAKMTKELTEIEKAAVGGAIIEVKRDSGKWSVVAGSKYARRIDAETAMEITGPAAASERLKTKTDPTGRRVNGMLNNCAGGVTPWGTWLSCEENFHGFFWGRLADGDPQAASFKRYGIPSSWYAWGKYDDRFDVTKEPNEANRFGWVVEIDPFDPASTPKKRTAMGRFKHEGAAGIINKDGRYVIYQGDDERFEYVYRFVTRSPVDRTNPAANRDLLDDGALFVAKYDADGSGQWVPLTFGQGPLTAANGFNSQADVLIDARRAGDLLGATRMDRPEDAEANPKTNKVYVIFTNNTHRKDNEVDGANPRAKNEFGHIIEMTPPDGDHAAATFKWEILVKCGDPSVAAVGATFSSATTEDGWFGMPDNCAIDSDGRLWISTDGNSDRETGRTDGLWALETDGEGRATSKLFFRCPAGAELCGPEFTPDGETLFVAVQHPGDDGPKWKAFGRPSSFEDPSTRWPDFQPGMPPRPSVLVITRRGGGKIAS
jgi:uncharacterized protein